MKKTLISVTIFNLHVVVLQITNPFYWILESKHKHWTRPKKKTSDNKKNTHHSKPLEANDNFSSRDTVFVSHFLYVTESSFEMSTIEKCTTCHHLHKVLNPTAFIGVKPNSIYLSEQQNTAQRIYFGTEQAKNGKPTKFRINSHRHFANEIQTKWAKLRSAKSINQNVTSFDCSKCNSLSGCRSQAKSERPWFWTKIYHRQDSVHYI